MMTEITTEEPNDGTAFDENTDVESPKVTMVDALKASNLVPLLAEVDVARIGSEALAEYQIDLASCEDFHKRYDRSMDMAMQVRKDKTFPWPNASNVIFPLLTQAAIQFQARAYPAIIDGSNVVKGKVLGDDPDGQKQERADRIGSFMTWQYLNDVPGWEEDTDKLLLQLPIVGCVMRKTWHDPIYNRNNSETVTAKDFVVHYKTVSLDKAPRFTHVQRYYPHEIEAFIRTETWAKIHYDGDDGSDPHSLVEMYEQHRLIDMDGDGLPEPYVVTLTKDGAVARIVACYDADSIYMTGDATDGQHSLSELLQSDVQPDGLKVVRIERKNYFTKYGFIPAPDGSFYDIGFGSLTDNLGSAVNTIINQLIDAGTLANMQGGFLGGGTKIKGGNMRFSPGEWKRVEGVTSGPLRDNILPLQLPGPSSVLFQLLGMLIESVKGITSVADIMTGNQETQTAPTTALALIEQGQKVFTAIYQRVHRAFGQDIKIMRTLNRDYLDDQTYTNLEDKPAQIGRQDFQDKDLDVVPVSDPRAINDHVKMAKAQILMAHNGDPLVNQEEIRKREFEAAGITNIKALLDVPKLPPPPEALANMAKLENEKAKGDAAVRASDALAAKTLIEAATAAFALGQMIGDANITIEAGRMMQEAMALADSVSTAMKGTTDGGQPAQQPAGLPGMEGQPTDAGLPAISDGPPAEDGDALGGGVPNDPTAAGAGGGGGGLGEPVM